MINREEAKEIKLLVFDFEDKPYEESLPDEMILIIDKIYDSFEAHIQELEKQIKDSDEALYVAYLSGYTKCQSDYENRTCESCEFRKENK